MMCLDRYPKCILEEIERFAPVLPNWAYAAGITTDDVIHDIAISFLAGEDPLRAVPKALKIRKVGGVWRPLDASVYAGSGDSVDEITDERENDEGILEDASGIAMALAGGTDRVAERCQIGLRAAQKRVKNQQLRYAECGDLFAAAGGV